VNLTPEQTAAVAFIITAVVAAGIRGIWVWGWVHQAALKSVTDQLARERTEKAFWRNVALKSMGHTDKALEIAASSEKPTRDG